MSEELDISSKVKELVSYYSGIKVEQLSDLQFIEGDLGVTGDDAWELMESVHKKFDVDLLNFEFTLHFAPEAGTIDNKEYGRYPVTIAHLILVTKNKAWSLPSVDEDNFTLTQKSRKTRNNLILSSGVVLLVLFVTWRVFFD